MLITMVLGISTTLLIIGWGLVIYRYVAVYGMKGFCKSILNIILFLSISFIVGIIVQTIIW